VGVSKEQASRSSGFSQIFWTAWWHVVPGGIDARIYVCAGSPGVPFAIRWRVLDNLRGTGFVLPEKKSESPCRSLDTAREAHAPLVLFISPTAQASTRCRQPRARFCDVRDCAQLAAIKRSCLARQFVRNKSFWQILKLNKVITRKPLANARRQDCANDAQDGIWRRLRILTVMHLD